MGTTAEKLTYLSQTKSDIRDAIQAKGVDVPANTTFRDYVGKVNLLAKPEPFEYVKRVLEDEGTAKNLQAVKDMDYNDGASLSLTPSGFKAGKLHSQLPTDGSGDWVVDRNCEATYTENGVVKTAQANEPRFENGALLVEPQATNLIPYSEDFSNAVWHKSGNTPIYNYGLAPDGTNTSTKISFVEGGGWQNLAIPNIPTPNSVYTFFIWIKKISGGDVRMWVNGGGTVTSPKIISPTNEWVRYELTSNVSDSTARPQLAVASYNGTIEFEVWGAQLEVGSKTSYIPTSGTTVTRLKDTITVAPPTGVTSITETFADDSTNVITTIPATHEISEGSIKKIIMT